jgi:hypothetical protein
VDAPRAINGHVGFVLRGAGAEPFGVMFLEGDGGLIHAVRLVVAPPKLRWIAARLDSKD